MATPTTVKVVPFRVEHVDLMDLDLSVTGHLMTLEDVQERLKLFQDCSVQSGTFLCGGKILCAAGFFMLWPGVAEGWIIPTAYIFERPLQYARTIKRYINGVMRTFQCHRLQTTAIDDRAHARWLSFLGFQVEGRLRQYTTDRRDFISYARVQS